MIHQLKVGNLNLPRVYICESRKDAQECRQKGVPYIIKPKDWDDEKLVKAVLYNTLYKKFPHIRWDILFGDRFSRKPKVHVPAVQVVEDNHRDNPGFDTCGSSDETMQVSNGYRTTGGGLAEDDAVDYHDATIDDYLGCHLWGVSIEELQALKVLPTFMDDIADAIKTNLAGMAWMDGYNKKLGIPTGYFQGSTDAPNLIILDTSGSIPSGVASTMVTLIDTLRSQANADLIITSGRSEYWKANQDLPTPDELSWLIGGCNECRQFYGILRKHILGKHWGNVIVFGDQDAPEDPRFSRYSDCWLKESDLQSTKIDRIMAFHTYDKVMPGYGLWCLEAAPKAEVVYNTAWVKDMRGY